MREYRVAAWPPGTPPVLAIRLTADESTGALLGHVLHRETTRAPRVLTGEVLWPPGVAGSKPLPARLPGSTLTSA